ncbi:MAG: glycosyltransferase family 2 protein [Flavobacterium sp.]|uniref:glycosyltransferase n=1 Tax=Flavobacterium sp. TaxID=239 RepID=UPI001B20A2D0|nr:glycosyltransferase [Flavobacterium sp.]MBO9585949.1 glycosyltransferase family 2 protein [Flavobacterium sp.]
MKKYENLLSIIIPTKNRYSTLLPVLDSIVDNLSNDYDYEIVVQDNSDDNEVCINYLLHKNDSRIKYFYNKESIPIADNTELAITNTNGKYLIFIGDDDFICPDILEIVNILDKRSISCLIYSPGSYWWESVIFKKENYYHKSANLWLPKMPNKLEFIKMNPIFELDKTLSKGAMAYDMLPRFYHGIVLRSELEKLKSKIGRYIVGSCPDIDFAMSLAINIDEYYYVNYPVSIFGASKNSGGGWTALKKHFGDVDKLPFLRPEIRNNWNPLIPRIWSEKTIYPQTTSEVLIGYNVDKKLNLAALHAAMLVYEPFLEPKILKYIIKNCGANPLNYLKFGIEFCKKIAGLIVQTTKYNFKLLPVRVFENVKHTEVITVLKNNFKSIV